MARRGLWVSDWGSGRVHSVGADGVPVLEAEVASFPLCIDFLPDGRLLLVASATVELLRREVDGSLVRHADLGAVSRLPWNDIVVDEQGRAYVGSIGFEFPGGEFAPGSIVLVEPTGRSPRSRTGWPSRTGPESLRLRLEPGGRAAAVRRRAAVGRARCRRRRDRAGGFLRRPGPRRRAP